MLLEGEFSIFRFQVVDVHRPVRRLSCHKLIEGIPCYALNVMVVLSYLPDHLAY
jgi:hypothetical protein